MLKFFRAEILNHAPSPLIHGRKGAAFVHVDGIDSIFMRDEAAEVARAVRAAGGLEAHCLAWDFEMGIRQAVAAIEAELDIRLRLHRIPREIMEKNRTEVPPFYEVALLTADPVIKNGKDGAAVDIKLSNFVPSLSRPSTPPSIGAGRSSQRRRRKVSTTTSPRITRSSTNGRLSSGASRC